MTPGEVDGVPELTALKPGNLPEADLPQTCPDLERRSGHSDRFALFWAVGLQVFFAIPYCLAVLLTPRDGRFGGFIYNPDDPYVYLSWMRQAADGHWLFHNLFTLEAQRGLSLHLLFFPLGSLSATSGAPLIVVYHGARVILGISLVWLLCRLVNMMDGSAVLAEGGSARNNALEARAAAPQLPGARSWAWRARFRLVFATLGSGLGWTYFLSVSPLLEHRSNFQLPVDLWMTETSPFLSMLLNPLFVCGLCLLLASFLCLMEAERSGHPRMALLAGVCALLLGNIHSYDILLLHAVWLTFLSLISIRFLRGAAPWPGWRPGAAWFRYACVLLMGSPSVLYQYWVFHAEPVFRSRANVPTDSPGLQYYLLGLGLLAPLAIVHVIRRRNDPVVLWLAVWAILGLALPYAPVAFQRKLAIGLQIPYLLLAGAPLAAWIESCARRGNGWRTMAAAAVLVVASLSNLCFLNSCIQSLAVNSPVVYPMAPLYLPKTELAAMDWLRRHCRPGEAVLALPWMGNVIPSQTGATVYVGHWGETTDFASRWRMALHFYQGSWAPAAASEFLRQNGITTVYSGAEERAALSQNPGAGDPLPHIPGLHLVYSGKSPSAVRLYHFEPPPAASRG